MRDVKERGPGCRVSQGCASARRTVVAVLLEVLADRVRAGHELAGRVAAVVRLVVDAELMTDLGAAMSAR